MCGSIYLKKITPANTLRRNNVVSTSSRRHCNVIVPTGLHKTAIKHYLVEEIYKVCVTTFKRSNEQISVSKSG